MRLLTLLIGFSLVSCASPSLVGGGYVTDKYTVGDDTLPLYILELEEGNLKGNCIVNGTTFGESEVGEYVNCFVNDRRLISNGF